jgi:D-amino-acid oxidase
MANFGETDVLIIGAGVSGLTTAICLAEAGLAVRVLAQRPPLQTTSAVAGASWGPYMVRDPRVLRWSAESLAELQNIARSDASLGVRLVSGLDATDYPTEPPDWARTVTGFRECQGDELPTGYVSGWRYVIPLVDMPTYLRYLERRLASAGTVVEIGYVNSLSEITNQAPVIVNCSGLGSRKLANDAELFPTRGQLVVVKNPGIRWFFQDDTKGEGLTYFLPHGDRVVLGGCATPGSEDESVDFTQAQGILERCAAVEPLLRDPVILEHRVGLRPTRPQVRVELCDVDGAAVIHNYGHGGAGLTLSWGCAREIEQMIAPLRPSRA